jgi:hypothetical protein
MMDRYITKKLWGYMVSLEFNQFFTISTPQLRFGGSLSIRMSLSLMKNLARSDRVTYEPMVFRKVVI